MRVWQILDAIGFWLVVVVVMVMAVAYGMMAH